MELLFIIYVLFQLFYDYSLISYKLFTCGSAGGRHRGGRGHHDGLVGSTVKVRQGPYKGYRGRVVEIKGQMVRVELESQMKVVTGMF